MSKVGSNIYKRKDGRWEGRYIKGYDENGKAKYGSVYAKSYSDVKQKLANAQSKGILSGANNVGITFAELSERWLVNAKLTVKASTYAGYVNMLNKHILPALGGYRLNKLSSVVIDRFTAEKLESGRLNGEGGLSVKTVRDILSLVKSVIAYGERENLIVKDSLTVSYPKGKTHEMRLLTKDEQMRLESFLLRDSDAVKVGIMLCLYTGLRIGELCALQWKNISLKSGVLSIRKTIQRISKADDDLGKKTAVIIDSPKSKRSIRDIPIPGVVSDKLRELYRGNGEAFFLTGFESVYIEPRTLQNRFKACLQDSGIDKINFHALRHTFSSRCIESGMDAKCLSEILGHSNVNITLNRYVHSSFEQKRTGIQKLCDDGVLKSLSPSL